MAVIFTEGFDYYNGPGNTTASAVGLITRWITNDVGGNGAGLSAGRFGGQCISFYGLSGGFYNSAASLPGSYSSGAFGCATYFTSAGNNIYAFVAVGQGNMYSPNTNITNSQINLRLNADMSVSVYRGTTLLGTSAAALIGLNAWYYLEVEYVISSTVGSAKVYLNNNPTPILSLTGINTQNLATNTVNTIALGASSGSRNTYIDDVYVTDTPTRLGEQRVITSYVNGDSSTDFWSSSTGGAAPYTMLDEATCDGDTTYASSSTFNSRIVLTVPALPVPPTTVNAVHIVGFARKDETQFRQVALEYQNTAGAVSTGSTFTLGGSYTYVDNLMPQNPLTGAPWTATDVNSMKIGARVVS